MNSRFSPLHQLLNLLTKPLAHPWRGAGTMTCRMMVSPFAIRLLTSIGVYLLSLWYHVSRRVLLRTTPRFRTPTRDSLLRIKNWLLEFSMLCLHSTYSSSASWYKLYLNEHVGFSQPETRGSCWQIFLAWVVLRVLQEYSRYSGGVKVRTIQGSVGRIEKCGLFRG